jgi:hypothetical protein
VVQTNHSTAYIWTGVDAKGGTWKLSGFDDNDSDKWGMTCLVFRNTSGFGASGAAYDSGDGVTPILDLTTTASHSSIVMLNADWNANDGDFRVYLAINDIQPTDIYALETDYSFNSGHYTVYGAFFYDTGVIGTKTVGIEYPTDQAYSLVAIEVLPPPVSQTMTAAWFSM